MCARDFEHDSSKWTTGHWQSICCLLRMYALYAFNTSMQLLSRQKEILLKTKIEQKLSSVMQVGCIKRSEWFRVGRWKVTFTSTTLIHYSRQLSSFTDQTVTFKFVIYLRNILRFYFRILSVQRLVKIVKISDFWKNLQDHPEGWNPPCRKRLLPSLLLYRIDIHCLRFFYVTVPHRSCYIVLPENIVLSFFLN
jgi:hypothetical protein